MQQEEPKEKDYQEKWCQQEHQGHVIHLLNHNQSHLDHEKHCQLNQWYQGQLDHNNQGKLDQ